MITQAARNFVATVENRITPETYHDVEYLAFRCGLNDRRPQDALDVNRVRIDGWAQPFPPRPAGTIDGTVRPVVNCHPKKPGDWWNIIEMHYLPASPKDAMLMGPMALMEEWSAGMRKAVTRLIVNHPLFDAAGNLIGLGPRSEFLIGDAMNDGWLYRWGIDFKTGPDGHVILRRDDQIVATYAGPFGYGDSRLLYPQLGIYRNARSDTARMLGRFDAITLS